MSSSTSAGLPPAAIRVIAVLRRPFERFARIEAASAIALLAATLAALGWANSGWGDTYEIWQRPLRGGTTLHAVVNDGLMTLFFFLVGLEIRRELHGGELAGRRAFALPAIAAVGGIVAPAAIYLAFAGDAAPRGWGIPIATDIAFALGVLDLAGKRVPRTVRVQLLALAIFDDIGAIIVIAVFYGGGIQLWGVLVVAAGAGALVMLRRRACTSVVPYAIAAVAVWLGLHHGGIHPTLAGVVVALAIPAPAAARLEESLHPWVAFGVMPLFALANAGVRLHALDTSSSSVAAGVAAGLLVGKPAGVALACVLAAKLRIVRLPRDLDARGIALLGVTAGVGFTMSLFVSELAFAHAGSQLRDVSRIAVLSASVISAALAVVLSRSLYRKPPH